MVDLERKRPKIGVGVIVRDHNQVLLGKRKGAHGAGFWAFPGGHLEFGETIEGCAKRELSEETGLEALLYQSGPWVNTIFEKDKHYLTLFVFVDQFQGALKSMEPHKCEKWEWFLWNALPYPLFPPILSLIEKVGMDNLSSDVSNF